MFLHHTTPGCHMAEELFSHAPPSGPADDKKSPAETQPQVCEGAASAPQSALPVACEERMAVFSCLANESTQSVSRLLRLSDSRSGRSHSSESSFARRGFSNSC